MSFICNKSDALKKAVEEGDVNVVHNLLSKGTDPNFFIGDDKTLLKFAIEKNCVEIVKILVQYGAEETDDELMEYIYSDENIPRCKELVAHIIKYDKNKLNTLLCYLIFKGTIGEPELLDTFKLIIDSGLPLEDYLRGVITSEGDSYTPLHQCVMENRVNFASYLLEVGADIHKKTNLGLNCICVSLWGGAIESMTKLLVKNGAKSQINERLIYGKTALHRVCEIQTSAYPSNLHLLIKYGADSNILDDDGNTPLMLIFPKFSVVGCKKLEEAMIEELAIMKFKNNFICQENLEYIMKEARLKKKFNECLAELKKMKDYKFYNQITLYDFIKSRNNVKKLISLISNEKFVTEFQSSWNRKSYKHYGKLVDNIFEDIKEAKEILLNEEKHLWLIFKDYLPELVISNLAYVAHEDCWA